MDSYLSPFPIFSFDLQKEGGVLMSRSYRPRCAIPLVQNGNSVLGNSHVLVPRSTLPRSGSRKVFFVFFLNYAASPGSMSESCASAYKGVLPLRCPARVNERCSRKAGTTSWGLEFSFVPTQQSFPSTVPCSSASLSGQCISGLLDGCQ